MKDRIENIGVNLCTIIFFILVMLAVVSIAFVVVYGIYTVATFLSLVT